MQEGALTQSAVRIRCFRAQQQRGAVDGAAGQHYVLTAQPQALPGGGGQGAIHPPAKYFSHAVACNYQAFGTRAVHQGGAFFQGRRNSRDQHGLLGVGRAAGPTIAQVPAATDVARNDLPVITELFAAQTDDVVIGVGWHGPGCDTQALLHTRVPGRHALAIEPLYVVLFGPVRQRWFWRAEAAGPVDRSGAAHCTALQNADTTVGRGSGQAFLIEVGVGFGLIVFEVAGGF